MSTKFSFILPVLWTLLILGLISIPGTEFPEITFLHKIRFDKWVHVLLFLVLVMLWCRAYSHQINDILKRKRIFTRLTFLCILYGIFTELVQHFFIPLRSFDAYDILADGFGAASGYLYSVRKFIKK